jgi:hypothetical protein
MVSPQHKTTGYDLLILLLMVLLFVVGNCNGHLAGSSCQRAWPEEGRDHHRHVLPPGAERSIAGAAVPAAGCRVVAASST